MTPMEAAHYLRLHNAWRRDDNDDAPTPPLPPKLIGEAIDAAVAYIERREREA